MNLPYSEDAEALLCFVAGRSFPVIMESNGENSQQAERDLGHNRYTILSADPVSFYTLESLEPASSVYRKIRELQRKFLTLSEPLTKRLAELPFQGGIAGYLGYPKVVSKTELSIGDGHFGAYLWAIVIDHKLKQTCLAIHPNCDANVARKLKSRLTEINFGLQKKPVEAFTNFVLKGSFTAHMDSTTYRYAFDKVKNYIKNGDCYQVNLTQKFSAPCTGTPFGAYLRLRHISPTPFSAFIGGANKAVISLSPERFVLNRAGKIEARPIKGTLARCLIDKQQDKANALKLVNSEKDRAENLMIVDLLRNDLGKIAKTGSVKATKLFEVESYSNVHHLVSTVSASLADGYDSIDMLNHCFPGGSITGAPKLRAMEIIEEVEVSNRGPYCGNVFYWSSSGDFDSNIAIRTMQWNKGPGDLDSIDCWAGGGIVADSDCDSEYQECFDKIQNLMTGLEG
ncbi:MAG: aminodeoxychorismate synthase component I [Pseudohongiellaceae bacterium]